MLRRQSFGVMTAIAVAVWCAASAQAWVLLDDFESYDNTADTATTTVTGGVWTSVWDGTANSHVIDVEASHGQALQAKGGAAWRGAERDISGTDAAIAVDEVQTYFWQAKVSWFGDESVTDWVYDFMMGLTPDVSNLDDINAWQDFSVMPYINNAANSPYINAEGPGTYWAPMARDTWTNIWIVVDNDAADPTFDLYYSTGADAATLVVADANWRNFAGNVDLNGIGFMAAGWEFTEYYIDNIYYAAGEDLSNPVPEPASVALVTLGALLALRRRA